MESPAQNLRKSFADKYDLQQEIGRGGMAVVYAARDLRHERPVAIKVLSEEESAARGAQRFLREIRVAAGLNHPHILPLFDSGEVDGRLYFVMPLVQGESLRQRLRRDTRLPADEALCIAREIGDALAHAHEAGVIHRDVKPENILLAHSHALLADFGIARSSMIAGETLTQTGMIVGTPEYMSPEQLLGDDVIGPQSDIYALGCVLYEMLAGTPPHRGSRLQALVAERLSSAVPSVRTTCPDVTPSVERSINRALAARPTDRFGTARDFAAALAESGAAEKAQSRPDISLIVRPFDAVGGEEELEFFSDGMTEEVIGDLSKIRALRVISRTSAMRLKGTPLDVRTIGRDYDVRYVVTGSVRRAGNKLRVATEIVDAALDAPVWAGRFDGSADEPFTAQENVARGIVEALRISVTPEEKGRMAERPIADPRAYECHRKAMAEILTFTRKGLQRAESLIEQGLDIVGDNAQLFAGMGAVQWQRLNAGFDVREERLTEAMRWLERALAIDPELPDAHVGMAWIFASRGRFPDALRHLERALSVEPNHSGALAVLAVTDRIVGRMEHLRAVTARFQATDPFQLWGVVMSGVERAYAGDREGRDRYFTRAYEIEPTAIVAAYYGVILAQDGELLAARASWERHLDAAPEDLNGLFCLSGSAAAAGRVDDVRKLLSQSWALALLEHDADYGWMIGEVYAIAGLYDESIRTLEIAVRQGLSNVEMLESRDATLAPLRSDPRFAALVEKAKQKAAEIV